MSCRGGISMSGFVASGCGMVMDALYLFLIIEEGG